MTRKATLVVCPGRGTYNRDELGYLGRHHAEKGALLARFDAQRIPLGQESIRALDGADRFSVERFTRGDNASALIHACAYADFLAIDGDRYDVVAMTGNSMGWYTALACAGALVVEDGFRVVNTMGTLMQEAMIGGQVLYPFVDDAWKEIPGRRAELLALLETVDGLYLSIELGGVMVFAGQPDALAAAEKALDPVGRFPLRLAHHAAFHTSLQEPVARRGRALLPPELLRQPKVSLLDGRGHTWWPGGCSLHALWSYTFGTQVLEPYSFTSAVRNGLREFAPDTVVILGPGRTLGGAVAQILIADGWQGLRSKQDFLDQQSADPFVLAMGIREQRARVVAPN